MLCDTCKSLVLKLGNVRGSQGCNEYGSDILLKNIKCKCFRHSQIHYHFII